MSESRRPLIIGITGGLGSGKTSVARLLWRRGLPVIDADCVARSLLRPGEAVFAQVVAEFGRDLLRPDGELDRRKLGERVFSDPTARRRLEDIVHPVVIERVRSEIEACRRWEPRPAALALDVPLLYEVGMDAWCDEVWVVYCDCQRRVDRIARRDGLSAGEIRRRMAAQMSLDEKVRRADRVIDNTGSDDDLTGQVEDILAQLGLGGGNAGT